MGWPGSALCSCRLRCCNNEYDRREQGDSRWICPWQWCVVDSHHFWALSRGAFRSTNPCSVISLPNTCPAFSQGRIQILVLPLVGSIKEAVRFVWPPWDGFSVTAEGFTPRSWHCPGQSLPSALCCEMGVVRRWGNERKRILKSPWRKRWVSGRRRMHGGQRKKEIIETLWRNIIWKNFYPWHKRKVLSGWKVWVNGPSVGCHIHFKSKLDLFFKLGLNKPRQEHTLTTVHLLIIPFLFGDKYSLSCGSPTPCLAIQGRQWVPSTATALNTRTREQQCRWDLQCSQYDICLFPQHIPLSCQ